jgi:hypothetical protein
MLPESGESAVTISGYNYSRMDNPLGYGYGDRRLLQDLPMEWGYHPVA